MPHNYDTEIIIPLISYHITKILKNLAKALVFTWRLKMAYKQGGVHQWEAYKRFSMPQWVKEACHGLLGSLINFSSPLIEFRRSLHLLMDKFRVN